MVHFQSFHGFCSLLDEMRDENIQFKLFGTSRECFTGAHVGWDKPPNNSFSIKLVALSSIGTIYCSETIKLTEVEQVAKAKAKLETLSITSSEITYRDGLVSIS